MKLTETPEYKGLTLRLQWAIDDLIRAGDDISKKEKELNDQLAAVQGFIPAQKFKTYLNYPTVFKEKRDTWGNCIKGTNGYSLLIPVMTVEELTNYLNEQEKIYQANKIISESNAKSRLAAFKFMEKLGIEKTSTVRKSTRSYSTKEVQRGWVAEIESATPVNYDSTWNDLKRWVAEQIKKIEEYNSAQEKEAELKKREEAQILKDQEKTALIVRMVEKYKLIFDSPIPHIRNVCDEVAKQNKYLYLARYLAKNRDDWNDGYSLAEHGLNYFNSKPNPNTEEIDSDISVEISSYFENFDDGRCFRDAPNFSYDTLFSMVEKHDAELYADYKKLAEYDTEYR